MAQYLRDTIEVEAEDWPDALLNASIREGYERVIAREQRWPFFEDRWSLDVTSGRSTYDLTEIGNIREVSSLRLEDGTRLEFTDEGTAEVRYTHPGRPAEFSRWGSSVTLWPTPGADVRVDIRGYRQPLPFQAIAGWTPDLPEVFHPLLCDWALANEYQRQDDPEMMTTYRNKFEEQLLSLRKGEMSMPTPAPLIVGGNALRARPWTF